MATTAVAETTETSSSVRLAGRRSAFTTPMVALASLRRSPDLEYPEGARVTIRDPVEDPKRGGSKRSRDARVAGWAGIVAHGLLGVFPYSTSGLLAPPWAVVTVAVVWVALLAAAVHLRKNRPWLVAATPIASLAFWFAFMTFGDLALGWTA